MNEKMPFGAGETKATTPESDQTEDEPKVVLRFGVGTIFGGRTFRTDTYELSPDLATALEQANAIMMDVDGVTSHLTTEDETIQLPDGTVMGLDDFRELAGTAGSHTDSSPEA